MSKKSSGFGFIGGIRKIPDRDDGRRGRIASGRGGNKEVWRSKFLDTLPHPAIEVVDSDVAPATAAQLFEPTKGTFELGLGNRSSPSTFPIIRSSDRELLKFGKVAPPRDLGGRGLFVRGKTGDEILSGIRNPDVMESLNIASSKG